MDLLVKKMEERGIKPTSVRLLILREMLSHKEAFSLGSLEIELDSVDKSTLSRTINLFHKNLLIHSIDDGSGTMKYAVCSSDCSCSLGDLHVHFNCHKCGNTFCMETISIPTVKLPKGFLLESVNFVLKGLCDSCSKFAT